jgi:hypothetical protein
LAEMVETEMADDMVIGGRTDAFRITATSTAWLPPTSTNGVNEVETVANRVICGRD